MHINEFRKFMDCKVLFINSDGNENEGIVKFLRVQDGMVDFEHVFQLPGYEYEGGMIISASSIISVKLLVSAKEIMDDSKFDANLKLMIPGFGKESRIVDFYVKENCEKYVTKNLPKNLQDKCPDSFCIVDSFSEDFDKAIDILSSSETLGVSFQGAVISHNGILSWVCVSTSECVYLFDIDQLGKEAFDRGLRGIFQDENIEKVVHDCRLPAYHLVRQFETKLNNVVDTQVADYLINMQMYTGQGLFKYVSSYDTCLAKYLKLPVRLLHNRNKVLCSTDEKRFFAVRPLTIEYVNILLKSSMFLLLLKKTQDGLLLHPYRQAVDVHLNSLRRADSAHVYRESSAAFTQIASPELLECIQRIRFQEVPTEDGDSVVKSENSPRGKKVSNKRQLRKKGGRGK